VSESKERNRGGVWWSSENLLGCLAFHIKAVELSGKLEDLRCKRLRFHKLLLLRGIRYQVSGIRFVFSFLHTSSFCLLTSAFPADERRGLSSAAVNAAALEFFPIYCLLVTGYYFRARVRFLGIFWWGGYYRNPVIFEGLKSRKSYSALELLKTPIYRIYRRAHYLSARLRICG
jgi:hypothetical protein